MPHGWHYVLPVGISFFTFQSMSYSIDFYLGKVARGSGTFCGSPRSSASFRSSWPGRSNAPSICCRSSSSRRRCGWRISPTACRCSWSACSRSWPWPNYLSLYVDRVYDNPGEQAAAALVLATFAFAWQIFFDFSGYTDMARGVARMMGFNLILNFNNPYLATGLGDFWSRWHISLSTWFRDYVYIPLGGNRHGTLATYRNLFITFLVSGIWHGANWTFAIWGMLHALGVMVTRELERSAFYRDRVPALVKQAGVFVYVCFAWIFFRATSLSDAWLIVGRIARAAWGESRDPRR